MRLLYRPLRTLMMRPLSSCLISCSELFVDRAESRAGLLAKVGRVNLDVRLLCLDFRQVGLDNREAKHMLAPSGGALTAARTAR